MYLLLITAAVFKFWWQKKWDRIQVRQLCKIKPEQSSFVSVFRTIRYIIRKCREKRMTRTKAMKEIPVPCKHNSTNCFILCLCSELSCDLFSLDWTPFLHSNIRNIKKIHLCRMSHVACLIAIHFVVWSQMHNVESCSHARCIEFHLLYS